MDFCQIKTQTTKRGVIEVYPDFKVCRSKDLMVRGGAFYAIWDEDKGLWSTDEYSVQSLIDKELANRRKELEQTASSETSIAVKWMSNYSSKSWTQFKSYISNISDNAEQLDEKLAFSNTEIKKKDYISRRLPYPLSSGICPAWDEIVGTLYNEEERAKIEWAIGSIVSGDSRDIQKFLVFYGEAGTGKSTIMNIVQKLFEGYYVTFDAKSLTSNNNAFSTEVFRSNPLVAIQHDGDLSRIEDNTKLNSIVSHEMMTMNEKYKSSYMAKANCFLFMGTNRPVKITDAKSGVIRRLIDVKPSGKKIPPKRYNELYSQIDFELGAIASHCLEVYKSMGKNYYSTYRPVDMIFKTDVFYNFVEDSYEVFAENDCTSLKAAYAMYKEYCDESGAGYKLEMYKFREELKNYFREFVDVERVDGKQVRSRYHGFLKEKFTRVFDAEPDTQKPVEKKPEEEHVDIPPWLQLEVRSSLFDSEFLDRPAQLASSNETPRKAWSDVKTTLKDIDTKKLHYVQVPINLIVIDFDFKNENGEKDIVKNLEAAVKWPETYAELSKGGGLHLHYWYEGDPEKLCRVFSDFIEIKVFNGNSSLRRRLSKCNDILIAKISSGLPTKGEKVINFDGVKSEKVLRDLIWRNLRKEIHPGTKPSIDFIYKILNDAYTDGKLHYDVTDMRPKILTFALCSSHQSDYCMKKVLEMKFKSEDISESASYVSNELVFFDVEVFPNLFLVNWKYEGPDKKCVRMINPTPQDIEDLVKFKLIGFNCRRYDNHILYARLIGYSNEELYQLSQRIVNGSRNAMFGEAYNISYTDVYDFSSKKQSLKKFEIELGIHHQELGLPWDKPVPEERWEEVAEYCDNDVIATEAVFRARHDDFVARQILAEIAGKTVNDTTNQLTTAIIFGNDKDPQKTFVYPDLAKKFPGYVYDMGKSYLNGVLIGEGGRVYANPGMYANVRTYDVASMHPHSITAENGFGPYTQKFEDLMNVRIAIKHKDFDAARKMFDGKLAKFLVDESGAKALSGALKIAINSVYGLTAANFDNKFRDPRNKDNWVAKRGALFMETLRLKVQAMGATVVHIKTDSIKIANPTQEIEDFIMNFGKEYGYDFEIESEYERICLVNDAVYIAKCSKNESINGKEAGHWTATGAQFAQPYVFKALFSKEPIVFEDMCETKTVTSALYLDFNEEYSDDTMHAKSREKLAKQMKPLIEAVESVDELRKYDPDNADNIIANGLGISKEEHLLKYEETKRHIQDIRAQISDIDEQIAKLHNYQFVGKAGSFCPVKPGTGGGLLVREKDGKYYSAGGAKGYRWKEAEVVKNLHIEDDVDRRYYEDLCHEAIKDISQYGDFEMFTGDEPYIPPINPSVSPRDLPCAKEPRPNCFKCQYYKTNACIYRPELIDIAIGGANNGE